MCAKPQATESKRNLLAECVCQHWPRACSLAACAALLSSPCRAAFLLPELLVALFSTATLTAALTRQSHPLRLGADWVSFSPPSLRSLPRPLPQDPAFAPRPRPCSPLHFSADWVEGGVFLIYGRWLGMEHTTLVWASEGSPPCRGGIPWRHDVYAYVYVCLYLYVYIYISMYILYTCWIMCNIQ